MRILCLTLLILLSPYAHSEVYKWTDEQGNVHYGDRPGSNSENIKIEVDTSQATSTGGDDISREEKRQKVIDALEEDRIEKQEERAKKKAEQERNRARCNQLRDKLRQFKRATGIYTLDRDGNRVYQSADKRKQTEANIQRQINQYCR